MSETKGQNNKLPEDNGAGPTRSFDGSIVGAGNQIGPFRIEKELGRGGAGVVYLAHDTKLDRSVAIKSLPAELMENPKARTRFAREARVLASLNHPNIATIYEELNVAEGFNYLVLEYVSGQTVAERISGTKLKPQEALSIAQQIAEAIAAAHEHDVIHRDLKPENIKITLEGKVKVLDFGLAKALGSESEDLQSTVTELGRIIGTPAYMSPEQARGQMADKRSDIWAFGCILYEMLTGRCAFPGKTASEVLVSILTTDPDWQLLPPETLCVRGILNTCLQKDPDQRYQSATALLTELRDCSESLRVSVNKLLNVKALSAMLRRPKLAVSIVLLLMMLAAGISWRIHKERKIRWAREVVMPAILDLTREARYAEAFLMAREAERYISNDLMLARLWPEMSRQYSVTTNPSGAKLAYKEYSDVSGEWIELGNSPSDFMLPFGTYRWMISKSGYVPLEFVKAGYPGDDAIVMEIDLYKDTNSPQDMILIEKQNWPVKLNKYWTDKYEVTNEQFQKFVDAGGYEEPSYWKHQFVKESQQLSWEKAMEEFRDKTRRPGPATWEGGSFPEGQAKYPVSGVSWYEAAAYAEYVGKCLPTVYHWRAAAQINQAQVIIPFSNFSRSGLVPVGTSKGIGSTGVYDMAGNVREWCYNATDNSGSHRYILGGTCGQPSYVFADMITQSAWDRIENNGFRCTIYLDDAESLAGSLAPLLTDRDDDFTDIEPVSSERLEDYLKQYYIYKPADSKELNSIVDKIDVESSLHWRKEKITYYAAYNGERIITYLFLPKAVDPPYEPIIYFPGVGAQWPDSSHELADFEFLDFIIKSGRAVLYPVYKGTYERKFPEGIPVPERNNPDLILWTIQLAADLRRSVDYLMTRQDLNTQKLTYCGLSWGARISPIMLVVEDRIKFAIIIDGGFRFKNISPSADPVNFAQHVRCPVLMINGEQDSIFPLKTSQEPMFRLLGSIDKTHKRYPGGHGLFGLFSTTIRDEVLKWMDNHLGPVD